MKCKHCGNTEFQKRGKIGRKFLGMTLTVNRYQCKNCLRYVQSNPVYGRSAKILLLDIETIPGEYYAYDPDPGFIQPDMQIKDWSVVCWAAKWLFDSEVMGQVVTPKEAIARREGSVLEKAWRLMDDADVIVWHNGSKFDMKKLNTKFLIYGYPPPSVYLGVDTLKTAKETFSFSYNRLDELGKELGIGTKHKMIFENWKRCAEGDKEYLDKMLYYCKNDVAPLLEDVYLKMLPWMKNHPNLGLYADTDRDVCPRCESRELSWGNKDYPTPMGLWLGFRCNACGAVGRGHGADNKIKAVHISSAIPA